MHEDPATFLIIVISGGAWNQLAIEFVEDLGRQMTQVTNDNIETQYLFQRLSMAVQKGNTIAFISTFSGS